MYALSAADGTLAWSVHLASPVPAGDAPLWRHHAHGGVTSTMVIDPTSGTLFASAAALSGSSVRHIVVAIDTAGTPGGVDP